VTDLTFGEVAAQLMSAPRSSKQPWRYRQRTARESQAQRRLVCLLQPL